MRHFSLCKAEIKSNWPKQAQSVFQEIEGVQSHCVVTAHNLSWRRLNDMLWTFICVTVTQTFICVKLTEDAKPNRSWGLVYTTGSSQHTQQIFRYWIKVMVQSGPSVTHWCSAPSTHWLCRSHWLLKKISAVPKWFLLAEGNWCVCVLSSEWSLQLEKTLYTWHICFPHIMCELQAVLICNLNLSLIVLCFMILITFSKKRIVNIPVFSHILVLTTWSHHDIVGNKQCLCFN